jgi:hypothetical protein
MAFDGTEGGEITLQEAAKMTAQYRHDYPNETLAHFFGHEILERILSQESCMGIRFYYGIDEDNKKQLVAVGVDCDQNDMTNLVADLTFPCPDACSVPNQLNS